MARAALLLLLVFPVACGPAMLTHLEGRAMGTFYSVDYVGEVAPDKVEERVRAALDQWDRLFSTYRKDSEISRFNAHNSTEPIDF